MNNQEQLNRMKAMMTYGLQTEGKKNNFSSLEYNRLGADGKMYGIVREGTKYYIKVSENTKELIKENFNYIGGFRNRKSNEYTSYANALKHFDLSMRSLNEACGKEKKLIAESWNPEKQEFVMVEATQKMKDEIARQRQIMSNASVIFEGKDGCCDGSDCSCQTKNEKKDGAKKGQYTFGTGDAEKANGVGFEEDAPKKPEDMPNLYDQVKTNVKKEGRRIHGKRINEADNGTLAWHKTGGDAKETMADTYLDTSHGTEIGDGAPFDGCPKGDAKREMKNGTVEEGTSMAMDCGNNQNNPKPGVNNIGNGSPFNKKNKKVQEEGNLPDAPKQVNNLADDDANDEKGWWNDKKKGLHEAEDGEEPMNEDPMGGEEPMGDDAPMGGEDPMGGDAPMGGEEPMGDDAPMGGEEPMGGDAPMGGEEPMGDDMDLDDEDPELEGDEDDAELEDSDDSNEIADLRSEIDSLKDLVASVAEKLGVSSEEIADSEFNDGPLYDDDDDMDDDVDLDDEGDDFDFDDEDDLEDDDFDFDDEDEDVDLDDDDVDDEDDDTEVFESRSYRRMKRLNEDRLDYFGKHPAYRKVPMQLPTTGEDQNEHGRDWNDESAHNEQPYGEKIGSGAPFEVDPEEITNAIAESVKRIMGRRKRI